MQSSGLPDDNETLSRLFGMPIDDWKAMRDDVFQFFEKRRGRWFNSRIDQELEKARELRKKKKKAAAIRWKKDNAPGMQVEMHLECTPSPSPSSRDDDTSPILNPSIYGENSAGEKGLSGALSRERKNGREDEEEDAAAGAELHEKLWRDFLAAVKARALRKSQANWLKFLEQYFNAVRKKAKNPIGAVIQRFKKNKLWDPAKADRQKAGQVFKEFGYP